MVVFKNVAKFTKSYLCRRPFSNKFAGLGLEFYCKEAPTQVFFGEFCENSKRNFFTEYLRTAFAFVDISTLFT